MSKLSTITHHVNCCLFTSTLLMQCVTEELVYSMSYEIKKEIGQYNSGVRNRQLKSATDLRQ